MATVVHPHLATIFGAEMWRGTPMLVVEYLEAGTLADRLQQGWLPVVEVMELGIAIASALERLHGRGLLHRDIKPSNIGFTGDRIPKLLDFGLVKFLEAPDAIDPGHLERLDPEVFSTSAFSEAQTAMHPASVGIIGTPLYFSPETVMMKPAEASVDLWALALVLFESLTAQHPMKAPTLRETFERILHGPVPDARALRSDCPQGLAAFFERGLNPDPGRRPASAREFRLALERLRA
jgi:serine/threonine-protein kinase